MGLSLVHSRGCAGVEAPLITVEVHLSGGLPSMHLVGLPETAVKESKHRDRSALVNSGFKWPQSRITISLAPAGRATQGGGRPGPADCAGHTRGIKTDTRHDP